MFSANQRQHLLVAFKHFDEMLGEVLARIGAPSGSPLFQPYRADADAATREGAEEAVVQAREAMRSFMATHALRVTPSEISALHAAHAILSSMQVSAMELASRHVRGYGELSAEESEELDALSTQICERLAKLDEALNAGIQG